MTLDDAKKLLNCRFNYELADLLGITNAANAELNKIYQVFSLYFEKLKEINEIVKTGDEQKIISISKDTNMYIQNGMSLAAIMANLISTPLFKVKRNVHGDVFTDKDGHPEILVDDSGMQVLDIEGLENALKQTHEGFNGSNTNL
ncbi:MAG: hypothetical protein GAK29_00989 [Acinetobacter bereziniae]|uniref:Uncharacterized protein n=1 Tax=Acinetobacter bereziniae TaxID=106648 RepID=A0A833PH75_ACIBZ|nr:MAG: hypothetical protein GAK29_00989 [Acinetobacter bereziniae]